MTLSENEITFLATRLQDIFTTSHKVYVAPLVVLYLPKSLFQSCLLGY